MAKNQALVERDVTGLDASIEKWTDKEMALIAATVAKGANGGELRLFLAQAASLNLSPLNGEIWCVKTGGSNGGEGRIAIIVGEQGRLKVANRYPDYDGFRSDVVCKEDRFVKLPDPKELPGVKGQWTYIEHSYGKPEERGEVVGAWCEVYRQGKPATFFYAPLNDYMPTDAAERAKKFIPWFKTLDRQIVKCAISTAFRMAFPLLAGVYGEEEIDHIAQRGPTTVEEGIEWGGSVEVAERMESLFAAANNAVPDAYSPAKIKLMLAGLSDEERLDLAAQEVIPFIEANGGTVPEPGESVVGDDEVEVVVDVEPLMDEPGDAGPPDDEQETIPTG
jgi:hypothetical protein